MVSKHYIGRNFDRNYWPVIKLRLGCLSGHSPVVVHAHRAVTCSGLGSVASKMQGRAGQSTLFVVLNNGVGKTGNRDGSNVRSRTAVSAI